MLPQYTFGAIQQFEKNGIDKHGLPDLRANLNLAYDVSKTDGSKSIEANTPISYVWGNDKSGSAEYNPYYQFKSNTVLDFYLNYTKKIGIHSLDVMGGYSWQHFYDKNWSADYFATNPTSNSPRVDYPEAYQLVSFFGRLNYTLLDKYLLTFTLRDDGSSRFSKDNRWGLFPSAAFACTNVAITKWGVIGSFAASGWSNDVNMTFDATTKLWNATVTFAAGDKFKIRANGAWDVAFGYDAASGKYTTSGGDISVTASGTYTVTLDVRQYGKPGYNIILTKQ